MVDLHRHNMFSRFDGFGKPSDLAKLAKELGHTALGTSDHGNTNGLVQVYKACKHERIKAILGVEGYFLPKYKPQERGFHLCLFAKNLEGYKNLNTIQYEGEKRKFYNPIWDFDLLEEHHEGLICTTACIASYSSQCILKGKPEKAKKYLLKLKQIFGDDLYVEIQPYKVSEEGAQEKVNKAMMELAEELRLKCILTSDSHYGRKEEFDTYLKMHEMDGHNLSWVEGTYKERYMPTEKEIVDRFVAMHSAGMNGHASWSVSATLKRAKQMIANLEEIESKVDDDILGGLELKLPKLGGEDNFKEIVRQIKEGLKSRGQYTKQYIERCKQELDVIKANGFIDYFLIVADYVNWAKARGICVGPGRGSVCNCLVAYAMHITEVDSIRFNLDFRRFMRYDKKAFPDIDIDFEMDRRGEVIEYLLNKYKGHSARVSSYGLYQVDNTLNELAKVCGLPVGKDVDPQTAKANKEELARIKRMINEHKLEDGSIDEEGLLHGDSRKYVQYLNKTHDGIVTHFLRLFGKVRFIGTHSAGVVITSGDVLQYTSLRTDRSGNIYASYNLEDLNDINIIKFDLLGLKTMQSIGECRKLAGIEGFDVKHVNDANLLEQFRLGNTSGVFQFESGTAKRILDEIHCDCFDDVVATCAMNRPGPLGQGMPEMYAESKLSGVHKDGPMYKYAKESYGTIVYQEQLLLICVFVGGLEWNEADQVLKANKHGSAGRSIAILKGYTEKTGVDLKKKFLRSATRNGLSEAEANSLWDSLMVYTFNKGHAAGYCIVAMEEMFYKYYYPTFFWYSKIKYAGSDSDKELYSSYASKSGSVVFLPHVNYSKVSTSIRKIEGEYALQRGLSELKGVGEKAAQFILDERKRNGVFTSFDNFYDRCKGRVVTSKVVDILKEQGALEFNKRVYIKRVTAYNSSLYSRAIRD